MGFSVGDAGAEEPHRMCQPGNPSGKPHPGLAAGTGSLEFPHSADKGVLNSASTLDMGKVLTGNSHLERSGGKGSQVKVTEARG